ncbi:MAG: cation:proton antiporter [Rikenellaceae bacterium]
MLLSLAYIFLLAMALGYIFKLLHLPMLLGMLITGVVLGSHFLDVISGSVLSISAELRQIALVVILLRAGLALDIKSLKSVGRSAVMMCFVPASFEIVGMLIVAPLVLGVSYIDAAIMGAVVAAVSPAVVVPKMLNLMEQGIGTQKGIPQMIMAGGSVDDVFVIVLFTAFLTLGGGGAVEVAHFIQIPVSIVLGLLLGVASGWAVTLYFKRFHMRDSLKLIILVSLSFLFIATESALKGHVPISGLLAVMAMGTTIFSRYETLARRISPKFTKIWVAAEILLFVLVGAEVDISYALEAGGAVVLTLALVMLFRMAGVWCSMLGSTLNAKERLFCMIAYLPKATVQAAIGSIPLAMGLPCGEMVLMVAVVAIFISAPLGALGIDMTYKRLLSKN